MTQQVVLFGAGTIGKLIARKLQSKGTIPVRFADNDSKKWGTKVEGIAVSGPEAVCELFPDAVWIPTALRTPSRQEIEAHIGALGVEYRSVHDYLAAHRKPFNEIEKVLALIPRDERGCETAAVLWDQHEFRKHGILAKQRPPRDISNVYFEDFFGGLVDEHFVDCGAADGDTIREFMSRAPFFRHVTAYEPDDANYIALTKQYPVLSDQFTLVHAAVGANKGRVRFAGTGDQTAHLDVNGNQEVDMVRLDDEKFVTPPTFIKMDIEGAELEALAGAREIISRHSPVLAVCAYHTADHIWQIPFMIHAINPGYVLYLRRYLEASWELVWYAVPRGRVL